MIKINKRIVFWALPMLTGCALFMEMMNATTISAALPSIARDFNVPAVDLKIAVMSYLLTVAMFIPVSGWFADRFGLRKVFVSSMVIFSMGSIACGFATNLWFLVLARLVQGVGGSMLLPVGRLILYKNFKKSELAGVVSKVPILGLLGAVSGPVIGGAVTTFLSWHWIFFLNVPIALIAIIATFIFVEDHIDKKIQPLDKFGLIFFGLGLATLLFLFESIGNALTSYTLVFLLFIFSMLMFVFYSFHAKRKTHPLLDLTLFRINTFKSAMTHQRYFGNDFNKIPVYFENPVANPILPLKIIPYWLYFRGKLTSSASGSFSFIC